jgi:hypothetical protein
LEKQDIWLTVTPEVYNAIDKEAERQGQTIAALVRMILNDWFEKKNVGAESGNRRENSVLEQSQNSGVN